MSINEKLGISLDLFKKNDKIQPTIVHLCIQLDRAWAGSKHLTGPCISQSELCHWSDEIFSLDKIFSVVPLIQS